MCHKFRIWLATYFTRNSGFLPNGVGKVLISLLLLFIFPMLYFNLGHILLFSFLKCVEFRFHHICLDYLVFRALSWRLMIFLILKADVGTTYFTESGLTTTKVVMLIKFFKLELLFTEFTNYRLPVADSLVLTHFLGFRFILSAIFTRYLFKNQY